MASEVSPARLGVTGGFSLIRWGRDHGAGGGREEDPPNNQLTAQPQAILAAQGPWEHAPEAARAAGAADTRASLCVLQGLCAQVVASLVGSPGAPST